MFSLGALYYQLLYRCPLFVGENQSAVIEKNMRALINLPQHPNATLA
jgi:hypothetical protein